MMNSPKNDITKPAITIFWIVLIMLTIILAVMHHFNFCNFKTWHWIWVLTPVLLPFAIGIVYIVYVFIDIIIQALRGR